MPKSTDLDGVVARYRRLQRYVGWSDRDSARLVKLGGLVRPFFSSVIDDFYDMIKQEPEAAKVITGGVEQIERLKETLHGWLEELFAGRYDRDYVLRRWRVGWRHVDIGLASVFASVALSRLRSGLLRVIALRWQGESAEYRASIDALNRLLDLDLTIIQDAYETEYVRRQRKVERQKGEAVFRELVEAAGSMIVILRADHSIAYLNPFAESLTGYARISADGQDFLQLLVGEEDRAGMARLLDQILEGATTLGHESAIICRDGTRRWLLWNVRRLGDFMGQPAVLAIGQDVSEQKEATEALRESEQRLQLVLDATSEGVWDWNVQTDAVFYSPGWCESLGYRPEQVVPDIQTRQQCIHPDDLPLVQQKIEQHLAGETPYYECETRLKTSRGTYRVYLDRGKVVERDEQGRPLRMLGTDRDISEQKRAEERALQAERLAAIGQTVTGLAHESRNAFQRSQACLELLELELEGQSEQLELVDRIQRALDHLHRLYEEVRDYAAPIKLDRQACDLAHLWHDAWAQLEVSRSDKKIVLVEEIADVDLSCQVDWFAMGQVFRNVLENAVAACPQEGRITIRCRECYLHGRCNLETSICDNGPGVPADVREELFNPFFTTKTKGTGLGMAIARRILEAHDGHIWLADSTGDGAEFVILLPRT